MEEKEEKVKHWPARASAVAAIASAVFAGLGYWNNQKAAESEEAAKTTYQNIQKERNTILNDAFAQAMHFGAVISGQGSKNGKTDITIKYNNQSGLPIRDVYFILLPNNSSVEGKSIAEQGMYFSMHVVDANSSDLFLEEDKIGENDIKNNYYVALLFKDSQGKYWVNDYNGLKQISQSKEESLINKLSYKMNLTSN